MHNVSANYTLPTVLNSLHPPQIKGVLKARDTGSTGSTTSTTSTDPSSATSASGIGGTFLNLLATELKNQDPTDPVDSTAMVGQMISLNQLDQLISINQTITAGSTATTASGSVQAAHDASPVPATSPALATPVTVPNQLPFDPTTMMPVGTSGIAASLNSALNAATLGFSGTNNSTTGGK